MKKGVIPQINPHCAQNDCNVKSVEKTAFKCLECVPSLSLCNNGVCLPLHYLAIQNETMGPQCEAHCEQSRPW